MTRGLVSERFNQHFFVDILLGLIPDLPISAASLLSETCLLTKYDPGDLIIREGEPSNGIFLLIVGTVQLSISNGTGPARKEVALQQISAPAMLGIALSMLTQPALFTVTTLTSVEIAFISQSRVRRVLRDFPQAGLAFSELIAHELVSVYAHLAQLRCPEEPISVGSLFD